MTLDAEEFIRRFLLHVLPPGFQRIRYYGLFAVRFSATSSASANCSRRAPAPRPALAGRPRRNIFPFAPVCLLRRQDDHRRNLRRHAPRTLTIADPDQDRHLMTAVTLPAAHRRFSSPPAARRSSKAMSSPPPQTLQPPRPHPPQASSSPKSPIVFAPDDHTGRLPSPPPHGRSVRDLQFHAPSQKTALFLPAVSLTEVFVRRPRAQPARPQRTGEAQSRKQTYRRCERRSECALWRSVPPAIHNVGFTSIRAVASKRLKCVECGAVALG